MRRLLMGLLLLGLVAGGCAGDDAGPGEEALAAAETYFTALADADYDAMAAVSTGLALTAARYGQQVLVADPDAFGPRDLVEVTPLAVGDGEELDGALELRTKGLDDGGLRITDIAMAADGDGWLVADYARDGRPLSEVFRPLAASAEGGGWQVSATVALTDVDGQVLLVPIAVSAGDVEVEVVPDATSLVGATAPGAVEVVGAGAVSFDSEGVMALVFRDVADPTAATAIDIGLLVQGSPVTATLPLAPAGS